MAEHDYDEVQEIELDYTGYTRPFNRSSRTKNEQQKKSIARKTTGKPTRRCVFLWIGIFIGSIVSGITVFLVVKYGGILSYVGSSCLWTEWTEWTGCNLLHTAGREKRVQIFTGNGHNCQQKVKGETRICNDRKLDIRFDQSTLYSTCYLSSDLIILGNRHTARTAYKPITEGRFQNYQGAMVNTCVKKSTSIYYEIYFQYLITSNLSKYSLILELGIGESNTIDNYHYVGNSNVSGWSFHLQNCFQYSKVCLEAEHQPHGIYTLIKQFSNNTPGTNVNGTFGILIDRERNKFSLLYNDTVLFTFHDVLSNVSLCPVFGVYSSRLTEVDVQIVSAGNMTLVF